MSVDFNRIKKYSKTSNNFDEKLEYLNKELKKTGLDEAIANTTGGVYVRPEEQQNQNYNNFEAITINGYGLGLSGGDGNGAGNAYVGTITLDMRLGHAHTGMTGVAISPPHPVTGQRRYASTQTGIGGAFSPLRPGTYQGSFGGSLRGGALWFYVPTFNNGEGQVPGLWLNFEWMPSQEAWGWYDTSVITGSLFLNPNLDEYEAPFGGGNLGTTIKNSIANISFSDRGAIGTPQTTVLTQNRLDDPGFLPITIKGLSKQGFNYLKGKAGVNVSSSYYSIDDKKNVDPVTTKTKSSGSVKTASTVISTGFPPSPPDKEPVDPPPETPDEPPAPPEPSTDSDEKADPAGLDARAIRLGYNDPYYPVNPTGHYTAMVTTAQDILSAEMDAEFYSAAARGESPNYNTTTINNAKEKLKQARADLDNWERWKKENNYIWKGSIDSSAENDRRQALLDKDKALDKEKEKLDKETEKNEKEAEEVAAKLRGLIAEIGLELAITLFGGKIATLTGKALGKIPAVAKFFKLSKAAQKAQIDDALKAAKKSSDSAADEILDALKDAIGGRTKLPTDAADDFIDFINSDLMGRNITKAIKAGKKTISFPFKGKNVDINVNKLQQFRLKGTNYQQLYQSHKPDGKLLSEAAKLGHFEPEALTVDIEDLRKGIMPEFPKDPPPKLIGGYSEKSRLAPVKTPSNSSAADIGKKPFIKITKKDLARNHLFTDSDIKEFMDTINKVNEYIKNHPEELIYAQERYPFHDPRLAQLNWQMDQMLDAGKEYIDKQFPENQKLFNRIKKKIKNTIDQTDPKNFKGTKLPKFDNTSLEDFKRKKEVYSRFMKKPVKTKKLFQKTKKRG